MKGFYFLVAMLVVITVVSSIAGSRGPAYSEDMFPMQTIHDALHFGYEHFGDQGDVSSDSEPSKETTTADAKPAEEEDKECPEDDEATEQFTPQGAVSPDTLAPYVGHEYTSF